MERLLGNVFKKNEAIMKYYYLKGIEKHGPYSIDEIKSRGLDSKTMILTEGQENWQPLSAYPELNHLKQKSPNKFKKKQAIWIILSLLLTLSTITVVTYYMNSLTDKKVRILAERFFSAVIVNKMDRAVINEIFPDFKYIQSRIDFKKSCVIDRISENSEGGYEVYATYHHNTYNSYPIYLEVNKIKGKPTIISSRGINYAYYNKLYEFGLEKGCFFSDFDDVEIGKIITRKQLDEKFDSLVNQTMSDLYNNLEISSNLETRYGYTSGSVTIMNNNNIGFDLLDFDCKVEFYDNLGNLRHTDEVSIYNLNANSSASGSIYSTTSKFKKYKVIPIIKKSDRLIQYAKDKLIEESQFNCFY
ncbi:DUF4339 domain-containing protein [Flavobacteriaceae bacterium]|nr:DUF4339 domain-containing protein [Flavobacteriaceae bacterium]